MAKGSTSAIMEVRYEKRLRRADMMKAAQGVGGRRQLCIIG